MDDNPQKVNNPSSGQPGNQTVSSPNVPGNVNPTFSTPPLPSSSTEELSSAPSISPVRETEDLTSPPPIQENFAQSPAAPSPQASQEVPGNVVTMDTGGKGSAMKKVLTVFIILLVLAGVAFAAWKFWPKGFLGIGKPGEIVWWGLWEDESVVQPLIDEYQNSHKGVKITYIKQSPQDYRERLMNSLAKEEGPDIFRFHNSWVPMFKNQLDPMPSTVMTPQAFSETYYPVISSDLTSGTSIVGIPLGYDALTLYINEDIFNSYGKTPPKTWEDFRQTASDLTIKDDKNNYLQYGAAIGNTENLDNWQEIVALMLIQNGVNLTKPDKQPDLASDALAFYKQFFQTDKVWSDALPQSTIAFAGGKVAMYFGPTWRAFEIKQLNKDLKFKTVLLPQLPKQSPTEPDISYATYWVEGVWNRSNNKDVAWDFLKFISSKESLEKLYKNAAQTRLFGEPYPRVDMADSLTNDPVVGSVIKLAPNAKSWYLDSRTFDGDTGINSKIGAYYLDLVNSASSKGIGSKNLKTVTDGVAQVLSQYGLAK